MTLSPPFLAVAGSVTGRAHRLAQRDGQDGYAVAERGGVRAVVVTDGCSSGVNSEVGARIGAAWIAALVVQQFASVATEDAARGAARGVADALVERLGLLARSLDPAGDLVPARIEAQLLFTFLAAVVTDDVAIVFGIGDGIVVANDATTCLDPGPENAPPYAAYALLDPEAVAPRVHFVGPTSEVDVLAVATDGLEPRCGDLFAFATDPRLLKNPSLLRKRLVVLADEGTLHDDATLGVLRRIP